MLYKNNDVSTLQVGDMRTCVTTSYLSAFLSISRLISLPHYWGPYYPAVISFPMGYCFNPKGTLSYRQSGKRAGLAYTIIGAHHVIGINDSQSLHCRSDNWVSWVTYWPLTVSPWCSLYLQGDLILTVALIPSLTVQVGFCLYSSDPSDSRGS